MVILIFNYFRLLCQITTWTFRLGFGLDVDVAVCRSYKMLLAHVVVPSNYLHEYDTVIICIGPVVITIHP